MAGAAMADPIYDIVVYGESSGAMTAAVSVKLEKRLRSNSQQY